MLDLLYQQMRAAQQLVERALMAELLWGADARELLDRATERSRTSAMSTAEALTVEIDAVREAVSARWQEAAAEAVEAEIEAFRTQLDQRWRGTGSDLLDTTTQETQTP